MIQQIAEIIKKGRTFLVTSHVRLDGDAVGSELALYEALRGLGKEVGEREGRVFRADSSGSKRAKAPRKGGKGGSGGVG